MYNVDVEVSRAYHAPNADLHTWDKPTVISNKNISNLFVI